jgi:hypothetical protein
VGLLLVAGCDKIITFDENVLVDAPPPRLITLTYDRQWLDGNLTVHQETVDPDAVSIRELGGGALALTHTGTGTYETLTTAPAYSAVTMTPFSTVEIQQSAPQLRLRDLILGRPSRLPVAPQTRI